MRRYALILLATIAVSVFSCTKGKTTDTSKEKVKDSDSIKVEQLTLAFTGDLMMGTNFPEPGPYLPKNEGRNLLDDSRQLLKSADLTIINLEGVCYDGTAGTIIKKLDSPTTFIFRMPGNYAQNLVDAGIDIVNMANNHSIDFGPEGRILTMENLDKYGILYSGLKGKCEGCVTERKGIKIGYVSFAASCKDCLDLNDDDEVRRIIGEYRKQCQLLIVGFHGGAEGEAFTHIPHKKETYVGEDRGDVYHFAHLCIDLGADMVIGHGPHVPRAMELYKGHLIAYSLGNFCGPYRLGCAGMTGHAPLLHAVINTKDGTFAQGQIHSFKGIRGIGPRKDATNAAAKDIKRLTEEDFPQTKLTITSDGKITTTSSQH